MGKAWDAFVKLTDKDTSIDVKVSMPMWFWVTLAVVAVMLIVAISVAVAYRHGVRGCDLAIHALTACLSAVAKVMGMRGNDPQNGQRPPMPLDHSRGSPETSV